MKTNINSDHKEIGKAMELFHFIEEAPGCVFWLPKGYRLWRNIEKIVREVAYCDYQEVKTPQVLASTFWEKSGHMQAYRQNMMHIQMGKRDEESAALKPMNCPCHTQVFKSKIRSYRDLPLRIAEFGACHRYEASGALCGLLRVRSFVQDDGHIFCTRDQIKNEVQKFINEALLVYKTFGFFQHEISFIIATRPDGFLGFAEDWDYSENCLKDALEELQIQYTIAVGDGAFYGPKIELSFQDSLQRSWTLGTIQVDFVLPERFDVAFDDENGGKTRPCMLHRAVIGTFERFIGILLEHTGGNLSLNIAPIQVVVCSITSEVSSYASDVYKQLLTIGVTSLLDIRGQTLGYKIREHKMSKIPIIITIGRQERDEKMITIEYLGARTTCFVDELLQKFDFFGKTANR
jgi:threonyl-tRNA synthetase